MSRESMFDGGHSTREVYEAFVQDYRRDARQVRMFDLIAVGLLLIAAFQGLNDGWPWLMGALAALFQSLRVFIDNSNRHFMMHALDWAAAERREIRESSQCDRAE